MLFIITAVLIIALIFGPHLWTRHVFRRYNADIEAMPGTGGELALHLLDKLGIHDGKVEQTQSGNDHYDPETKTVRLSPEVYTGRSLTAVTIAAHECGHALQHKTFYKPLYLRWKLARHIALAEKIASILLLTTPFLTVLTKLPVIGVVTMASGFTLLLLPVILHTITLPVEFNASFGRALPILAAGKYLPPSAMPVARKILTAAALTYLSASLASILNIYRWLVFLRR